jgi:hypothetical protein
MDLVKRFAEAHPSDRIRWCALRASAGAVASIDERIALYEAAAGGSSRLVAAMARREAELISRSRGWIEQGVSVGADALA